MEALIVDASIAIKWVVEEEGTDDTVGLRSRFHFAAPEPLIPECANILWKKVQRDELLREEAALAARLLEGSGIDLLSMTGLLEEATNLSIALAHPAYDCAYLMAAHRIRSRFVTADTRLLRIARLEPISAFSFRSTFTVRKRSKMHAASRVAYCSSPRICRPRYRCQPPRAQAASREQPLHGARVSMVSLRSRTIYKKRRSLIYFVAPAVSPVISFRWKSM
ncbi:type II toxin-antitoxin system VapC family toxin [Rhizobium tropici]|uniref:type II toxin-antitoxin system VapC family toxin n=1 Tax=Rhizobium tropici TaxID=398 RepID=UPI001FEF8419|nr:type II toxin-antitoxin system VapC family toxin [Rhizobium tropici]